MVDIRTFSLTGDFINQAVDVDTLTAEINASSIVVDLIFMNVGSSALDDVNLYFDGTLSGADDTELLLVIAAHEGITRVLEAFASPVISRTISVPPLDPTDGDRYIVPFNSVGEWTNQDQAIAERDGYFAIWDFTFYRDGSHTFVIDEDVAYRFDGYEWIIQEGPEGPQGEQGEDGYQGIQGEQGDDGYQGVQGDDGYQGVQGDQGDQGIQGEEGTAVATILDEGISVPGGPFDTLNFIGDGVEVIDGYDGYDAIAEINIPHASHRQLIHLADGGGPFEEFLSGAFREILPEADPFPTSIIWYESSSKLEKIVEKTITRNANKTPSTIEWKVYDTDGITVLSTITDTIVYTSIFEINRTRTIS